MGNTETTELVKDLSRRQVQLTKTFSPYTGKLEFKKNSTRGLECEWKFQLIEETPHDHLYCSPRFYSSMFHYPCSIVFLVNSKGVEIGLLMSYVQSVKKVYKKLIDDESSEKAKLARQRLKCIVTALNGGIEEETELEKIPRAVRNTLEIETKMLNVNGVYGNEKVKWSDSSDEHFCHSLYLLFTEKDFSELKSCVVTLKLTNLKERVEYIADMENGDKQLKVDGKTFKVVKDTLSNRSPVFEALLGPDSGDKIKIKDENAAVFDTFLKYLHDKVKVESLNLKKISSLYSLSQKYEVEDLKMDSVSMIINMLEADSGDILEHVLDILIQARDNKDELLKGSAIDFIIKHFSKIESTKKWREFSKKEPKLISEIKGYKDFCWITHAGGMIN